MPGLAVPWLPHVEAGSADTGISQPQAGPAAPAAGDTQVSGSTLAADRTSAAPQVRPAQPRPAGPAAGAVPEPAGQAAAGQVTAGQAAAGHAAAGQAAAGQAAGRRRGRRTGALLVSLVVVIVAGLLAITLLPHSGTAASYRARKTAALGGAAATRAAAAGWIAAQVSRSAIVACDSVMCRAIEQRAVPVSDLLELTPGSADPLGSDVVVATAAVRNQFGGRLGAVYAPSVIAVFGSGSDRIEIRAVASGGAQAYLTGLRADIAARKRAGRQLLADPRIVTSPAASAVLAAGQADSRLLITLLTMASLHPISILGFSGSAQGAGPGTPLRFADLAAADAAAGLPGGGYVRSLTGFLQAQRPPFLPAQIVTLRRPGGGQVLRIEYMAPSPVGLFSPP